MSDLVTSSVAPVVTGLDVPAAVAAPKRPGRNRSRKLLNGYLVVGGLFILLALVVIFGGIVFGQNPNLQTGDIDAAPSSAHLFGTDSLGRDLFARVAAGGLTSLEVALGAAFIATLFGLPLGMLAGFHPTSWLDEFIMRPLDVVLALPLLVLGVCVMGFIGPGSFSVGPVTFPPLVKVILLLGGAGIPIIARVARSSVLVEREEDYVHALRVVGVSRRSILFNDILRNVAPATLVQATAWMATAIFAEAGLGFLGLGIQPPTATLGNIMQQSSGSLLLGEWWLVVFPGAMAIIIIAGFNLIGDGLGRALFDPPRSFARPSLRRSTSLPSSKAHSLAKPSHPGQLKLLGDSAMATTDNLGPLTGAMVSRRRMLSGMAGVVALGSVSAVLAACDSKSSTSKATGSASAAAAQKGGTLVIDVKTEPAGYNPLQFPNAHVVWLSGQLYDPLYEYDNSGAVIPNLASGPPTTTDGKTWTVNLKTGIKFHNGDTFTADDVVATMQALATAPTNAFASQVGKIDSISAVSPTQVTFTLALPNYVIPDVLAILPMLNKNHVKDATNIIGTGPYKWSELVSGSHITFVANPDYHFGAPILDKVEFRFVPDANTRVVDLLQKTANVSMAPTFSTLNKLTTSSSVKLLDVPAAVMMPIHVNCNSEVFKDPRVRQALGFAMDRTRVLDTVFAGKAVVYRGGAVPPNLRGYDASNPYYPVKADVAKAKSLLAAAGVTTPVKFTVNVYNVAESVAAMQVIQQDWAAAGFDVTIQTLDLASWAKILVSKKFDMMVSYEYNGTWWGKDGINQLSNYASTSGTNWVNYSDPQFDALLAQSRATQDAGAQTKLWQQMDHMLAVAGVNLIPAVPHLTAGTQTNVVGIPLGRFSLCFLDLRKAGMSA